MLSVLLLREGDKWAAQCLAHDIAAQGDSIPVAVDAIMRSICAEMDVCDELRRDFEAIPPAPSYYRNRFDFDAVPLGQGIAKLPPSAKIATPEFRVA